MLENKVELTLYPLNHEMMAYGEFKLCWKPRSTPNETEKTSSLWIFSAGIYVAAGPQY